MNIPKLSKRLQAAASFARDGGRIADIGTDHAYLPIYLFLSNKIKGGVAADINYGPVQRAQANVSEFGVSGALDVIMTDGLCGVEKYQPDDIFILGMGGELIVKIISEASWVKDPKYMLCLQPMTHAELLREYLCTNGFAIIDECVVSEDKIYQIICAQYNGENYDMSDIELMFGRINIERRGENFEELLEHTKKVFSDRICGKKKAGADAFAEEKMIEGIERLLNGGDNCDCS